MGPILLSLGAGLIVGLWPRTPTIFFRLAHPLTLVGLVLVLFCMGASLGTHPNIIPQLQWIGLKAFVHASCAVTGSVLVVFIFERWFLNHTTKR